MYKLAAHVMCPYDTRKSTDNSGGEMKDMTIAKPVKENQKVDTKTASLLLPRGARGPDRDVLVPPFSATVIHSLCARNTGGLIFGSLFLPHLAGACDLNYATNFSKKS